MNDNMRLRQMAAHGAVAVALEFSRLWLGAELAHALREDSFWRMGVLKDANNAYTIMHHMAALSASLRA